MRQTVGNIVAVRLGLPVSERPKYKPCGDAPACPFCGYRSARLDHKPAPSFIICDVCHATGPLVKDGDDPWAAWNKRAPIKAAMNREAIEQTEQGATP